MSTDAGAGEETGLGAGAADAGATEGAVTVGGVTTDTDEWAGSTGTVLGPIQDMETAGAVAAERAGAGVGAAAGAGGGRTRWP